MHPTEAVSSAVSSEPPLRTESPLNDWAHSSYPGSSLRGPGYGPPKALTRQMTTR